MTREGGAMSDEPSQRSTGHTILRWIAAALALLAAPSAARDVYGTFRGTFDPILAIFAVCTTLCVARFEWLVRRGFRVDMRARIKHVLLGGLIVGSIGFALGFFGPLIWAPEANQGPLLGIFITGPIGFLVGATIGWFKPNPR